MRSDFVAKLPELGVGFDVETHLIKPGDLAPPLVCAGVKDANGGTLLTPGQSLVRLISDLEAGKVIIGANVVYDLAVMARFAKDHNIDIYPSLFKAFKNEQIWCIQMAERLHDLHNGELSRNRYSQEKIVERVLGITNSKANDEYQLSYEELDKIPFSSWPKKAKQYPIDDATYARKVALVQAGRNQNLHDLSFQVFAHWAMQLGAVHGLPVDSAAVAALRESATKARKQGEQEFLGVGLLKEVKQKGEIVRKTNPGFIKRKVALAFGANEPCKECKGSGRVPGKTKHKDCEGVGCQSCEGGKVDNPKTTKGCPSCSGTALLIDGRVPTTDKGGVCADRDTLYESGDEDLIKYAAWSEDAKLLSTYIPWLESAIVDDKPVPLTLEPRPLKETGRAGYGGVVHQLPRKPGVRECFVWPEGYVGCAADFSGCELVAHAQSCLNILGWSAMADALNKGIKVHDALGAEMRGVSYEHMVANRHKDKELSNYRQAAKALNFGLPGFMGVATLVLTQRRQGPDTVAPDGTVYKGLRFCILTGGERRCGERKVTKWGRRDIPPTCVKCLERAKEHREHWFTLWPENHDYFAFVKRVYESGRMTQHPPSRRVRGGAGLCSVANGYFQGLAGDLMKRALIKISTEQYTVKDSPLYGTRTHLPIHDEVLMQVFETTAHESAMRAKELMLEAMVEYCPDMAAAAEVDVSLMRFWTKRAEPVYKDGRLIPWEPS